jgi:hypothetical protein
MAKGKEKKPARKPAAKKTAKEPEELRLTQLEQVELNLCERDWEMSLKDIELADARIRNLTMDFHQKQAALKDMKRNAQKKSEQMALIRNRKLAEVEFRLRKIDPDFSFKDYLEQDDGLLVRTEDKVAALDPTAGDSGDGGDSVTA